MFWGLGKLIGMLPMHYLGSPLTWGRVLASDL